MVKDTRRFSPVSRALMRPVALGVRCLVLVLSYITLSIDRVLERKLPPLTDYPIARHIFRYGECLSINL